MANITVKSPVPLISLCFLVTVSVMLTTKLKDIFVEVKQRLHKSYLRKRDVSFVVGHKVCRRNKVLSDAAQYFSANLAPRFVLSVVVKKSSPIIYELANPNGSPVGRYHVKDLKPYFVSNSDVSVG
ncbi:hypothetical protein Zmor_005952 [Zophobas morio]|uniref:Uncharacterized protein n=1 Tax=Zophobas morio TaxID=2755281 RepID=A0AA38ITY3_9CUCU|nr:hypothetical protein Zmor_005952 [Zophobas morio]